MTVTKYQRIELDGKTYDLAWYGDRARVSVLTKKGPRTLNGYGRANQSDRVARVITEAKRQCR